MIAPEPALARLEVEELTASFAYQYEKIKEGLLALQEAFAQLLAPVVDALGQLLPPAIDHAAQLLQALSDQLEAPLKQPVCLSHGRTLRGGRCSVCDRGRN